MSDEWQERRSAIEKIRPKADYRTSFQRDRARLIHSAAFRRLQAKTQVLGIGEGDFHRTRLTHSMEVAQIARGITLWLKKGKEGKQYYEYLPGQNLIETIALAHDLGHPPFGHGGEVALNFVMRECGGFEGNGQTLRILSRLEAHTEDYGLNLTRRSLLGVLKYPISYNKVVKKELSQIPSTNIRLKADDWKPPKCYMNTESDVVEWILKPFSENDRECLVNTFSKEPTKNEHGKSKYHGFDTSIMELADDIAYAVHDFEDSIVLGMVQKDDFKDAFSDFKPDQLDRNPFADWVVDGTGYDNFNSLCNDLFGECSHKRKWAIGALVNSFIVSCFVGDNMLFENGLLRYNVEMNDVAKKVLDALKELIKLKMVKIPQVQTLEYRGQFMVINLFDAFSSDPERLLKDGFVRHYKKYKAEGMADRAICDYISGMTDEYAVRMYERLFMPRRGQFSDMI